MLHPTERELVPVGVARLLLGVLKVDGALVESDGCPGLHSSGPHAPPCYRLCEMISGRFRYPATCHLLVADVHQSVEERPGGYHHRTGPELHAPYRLYAYGDAVFHYQLFGLVLPDVEIVGMVEPVAPFPDKLSPVALRPWRPYGRSLALVEHSELDGGEIGDDTCLSP